MQLIGSGFIIQPSLAAEFGLGVGDGLENHIRPYRNGRDLMVLPRNVMVIDLFGLEAEQVREHYPKVYQHLLQTVKPERDTNNRESYRRAWWTFGEPRKDLRPALQDLSRYIVTVETSKHRTFQFLDAEVLPDNKLITIASDDAFHLGVLASKLHVEWSLRAGGWLGVGNDPVYVKSKCFDAFPFPETSEIQKAGIARVAEALDGHRKRIQAEHPDITLTEMYNVLEKLRLSPRLAIVTQPTKTGDDMRSKDLITQAVTLTPREQDVKSRGLILILREFHDELDAAVLAAYGWPQGQSDEETLTRLVALNKKRAAQEAAGEVLWLRPDYQIPRFGTAMQKAQKGEMDLVAPQDKTKPSFPANEARRTAEIFAILSSATSPLTAADIAARYRKGKSIEKEIALTLRAFVRFGNLASFDGGKTFQLRQVA